MNIGRYKLVVGVLAAGAIAASWLAAEFGGTAMGAATQTAALIGLVLLVAGVQQRESRRLAGKIDISRRKVNQQMDRSSEQGARLIGQLDRLSEQVVETSQQLERVVQRLDEERDSDSAGPFPATGVPQEHFEQLARILAANNERLESAVDDLARQLDSLGR